MTNREKRRYQRAGKKKEFTEANLPHNRFEVMGDLLRVRYDIFFKISGIIFAFALPLFVAILFFAVTKNALIKNYNEGIIDFDVFRQSSLTNTLTFVGLQSISLWILSIGISGLLRIVKRLVFYESIQFKEDFLLGIKTNGKQAFIATFLFSIFYFFGMTMMEVAIVSNTNDFSNTLIMFLPIILLIVIFFPLYLVVLAQIPIYSNTMGQNIKNALFFYIKKFYISLPAVLLFISPLLLLMIPNIYALIVFLLLIIVIIVPLEFVSVHIYCCYLFDKYLNKETYPEIYDKGIYRKNK